MALEPRYRNPLPVKFGFTRLAPALRRLAAQDGPSGYSSARNDGVSSCAWTAKFGSSIAFG